MIIMFNAPLGSTMWDLFEYTTQYEEFIYRPLEEKFGPEFVLDFMWSKTNLNTIPLERSLDNNAQ